MDYILQKLNRRIAYHALDGDHTALSALYRAKIEYSLLLILATLWDKHFTHLDFENKELLLNMIQRPSIGTILDAGRRLDLNSEVFSVRELRKALDLYPAVRNDQLGHGFTFADGAERLTAELRHIADTLFSTPSILTQVHDLVLVRGERSGMATGTSFKADGDTMTPWHCPPAINAFRTGSLYSKTPKGYHRLSPFIHMEDDDELYLFRSVDDRLNGKVKYNRLIKTGTLSKNWEELADPYLESDGVRRRGQNGTIINVFANNFNKYIDIGIKGKLLKFLTDNRSSVCATIWGHGGVGKTATVQSLCGDLVVQGHRAFDYVVFLSAKDRFYNYYTGTIEPINERVDSFESLIRQINGVISEDVSDDPVPVIAYDGRLLIVIDDYETFEADEKTKIENFIRRLDTAHHKVLITTRAATVIGDELQTAELNPQGTVDFLLRVMHEEFPDLSTDGLKAQIGTPDVTRAVYELTGGRPLFIFQLAFLWGQEGELGIALSRDIRTSAQASDFLFGRIYEYLSPLARDIFASISLLVTKDDLTNLIERIQFLLRREVDDDSFARAYQELVKLRIVETLENNLFRVYSKDILQTMTERFEARSDKFKRVVISRLKQIGRDKRFDNERALLANADAARTAKTESEVESLYRHILKRASSPADVRLTALLNFSDFLFNNRGKKDQAVELLQGYAHEFGSAPRFARMYSNYCWATFRREAAVAVLSEFFSGERLPETERNVDVELRGLLLTYRSILAIQTKEDLKQKRRYDEITSTEFTQQNREVKKEFIDIYRFVGLPLLQKIKAIEVESLAPGARQNTIAGLYQFVDVCTRLQKLKEAVDICRFVIERFPGYFTAQFEAKLNWLRTR